MAISYSSHFTLEELTTSQLRQFDNTPGEAERNNLKLLATETLEPVRELLGPMHVNSAYRSEEVNKAVGGVPTSQHILGLACDFVPVSCSLKEAIQQILDNQIVFDQLIYELGRWIHISHAPVGKQPRQQAKMIGKWTNNKYLDYDSAKVPETQS